jgi:hypothetical protein
VTEEDAPGPRAGLAGERSGLPASSQIVVIPNDRCGIRGIDGIFVRNNLRSRVPDSQGSVALDRMAAS